MEHQDISDPGGVDSEEARICFHTSALLFSRGLLALIPGPWTQDRGSSRYSKRGMVAGSKLSRPDMEAEHGFLGDIMSYIYVRLRKGGTPTSM